MANKILDLSLKQHWFDEIRSGKKKKEYRSMSNNYYVQKLIRYGDYPGKTYDEIVKGVKDGKLQIKAVPYTHIRFHCGPKVMLVEFKGLSHEGNNWVIDLGKVTERNIAG